MRPTDEGVPLNPYLAGALAGLVSIGSVWAAGKYLGASTTFVRATGFIERFFAAERLAGLEYFVKTAPKIDWQWLFVVGIFLGALVASLTDGSFRWQALPDMWEQRFGPSHGKRATVAFAGGVVAMFGARLADGCPSGHGLSGSLQLAVSGFVALGCFFLGGILMARILYGGRNER
ncbi:MAG: YeeE/YedE family protein [Proteobacteria bacterium]|nr:YeeE/YedE family protein [Desulfobulbaceae bacterium]MBU4154343.1 YeeE/YedE family protein [Pseudomonadota bacterium]MDP2106802.1 YeeE/YedE thiosulfate transporter family protein [Desulfobulbaceae bacterium]